ncbi:MAG: FAD-dependent oxidoreductase [Myxococcota bacterium]
MRLDLLLVAGAAVALAVPPPSVVHRFTKALAASAVVVVGASLANLVIGGLTGSLLVDAAVRLGIGWSACLLWDRLPAREIGPHAVGWLVAVAGWTWILDAVGADRGGVPVGAALATALLSTAGYLWLVDRTDRDPSDGLVARLIRWRLGGYRHQVVTPDPSLPLRPDRAVRVLVIGGGLAGLGTASALAERGVQVVLRERNAYLGGKIGAWPIALSTGETVTAEHGFHAFFRQYWNQRAWLDRLGITPGFRSIGDYRIATRSGRMLGFAGTSPVPVLNLLDLARIGVYSFWRVARTVTGERLEALLRYDRDATFAAWDHVSFEQFARDAQLPPTLKLVFATFTRAFFSDDARMSMAEMIKSFHFYYLSNDQGLVYDHPADDYDVALLEPIRAHLASHGVDVRLSSPVGALERDGDGWVVDGERFDAVVVAADPGAAKALVAPHAALGVSTGQRYAVLRLWLDRGTERDWLPFVITERDRVLDAITRCDHLSHQQADWAQARVAAGGAGSVWELHCYAVPDDLPDDAIRAALLDEWWQFLPELREAGILGEDLHVRADFPAFHTGAWATRPTTEPGVPGLYLAGDWVKLPWPAMLMEGAQVSALCAANAILASVGVQGWPVYSVPQRGLLHGVPEPPRRFR